MSDTLTIDYRLIFALMNGKVSNALRRRLNEDFRNAGLEISDDEWDALVAASQHDICTQQDLCNATDMSKPTMSRIITALEEKKIIVRRKARTDRRNNYVTLTRQGTAVVAKAQAIAVRTLKESLRGLSKMDIAISQHSLNTVLQNLRTKEQQIAQEQALEHHRRSEEHKRSVRRMHDN